MFLIGTI